MINLARTKTITTPALLLSLFVSFYGLLSYTDQITGCSALYMWMLPYVGFVLTVALVIVVARATMVTWITLLVLLAFAGNRRRVLAKDGRKITADVAMHLVRVVLKERGLVAMACVTIVSLMAWIA